MKFNVSMSKISQLEKKITNNHSRYLINFDHENYHQLTKLSYVPQTHELTLDYTLLYIIIHIILSSLAAY